MSSIYHHQQPAEWYYGDPNQHHHQQQAQPHDLYNNSYNNYKTDYNNCLNNQPIAQPAPLHHHPHTTGDPSMYNGYYYPAADYAAAVSQHQQQQITHPQMDFQHSNYHQNYHSSM